jgi:hypothetical protein
MIDFHTDRHHDDRALVAYSSQDDGSGKFVDDADTASLASTDKTSTTSCCYGPVHITTTSSTTRDPAIPTTCPFPASNTRGRP